VIQSVDRAARILNALAASSGRLGVSELSAELELAKGTVHGLVKTLRDHGLVEQDLESDKYQLGPALLKLSNRFLYLNEIRSRSQAWSESLAARTHESVRVGMAQGREGVLIVHHVFRPDASLQMLEVGAVLPLHATALGKAVLAHLGDDAEREVLQGELPKLTGRTLSGRALRTELAEVRARGYALEREEAVLGEASVAAPIFSRRGTVVGAIGVFGSPDRIFDAAGDATASGPVVEVARAISRELGAL
jgi:DNA-binding IclR family transcriptional regulator